MSGWWGGHSTVRIFGFQNAVIFCANSPFVSLLLCSEHTGSKNGTHLGHRKAHVALSAAQVDVAEHDARQRDLLLRAGVAHRHGVGSSRRGRRQVPAPHHVPLCIYKKRRRRLELCCAFLQLHRKAESAVSFNA